MKAVYKYPLQPFKTELMLPRGSIPLHVGLQRGEAMIWVEVSTDLTVSVEQRSFIILTTGANARNQANYVGTFFGDANAETVWHVYETTWENEGYA